MTLHTLERQKDNLLSISDILRAVSTAGKHILTLSTYPYMKCIFFLVHEKRLESN